MKKTIYAFTFIYLAFQAYISYAITIDKPIDPGIVGNPETADIAVQKLVATAAGFLWILGVIYAIWGWFNIMTAGGEEDKVKKGKSIILQAAIGLVVIWLANSIVQWIIVKLLAQSA